MSTLLSLGAPDQVAEAIAAFSKQNFYACYQCGKCTAACPFSLGPQAVTRFLQLGQVERALALDTPWDCAGCYTCLTVCPKGVNPARINKALRTPPKAHLGTDLKGQADPTYKSLEPYYRAHRKGLREWLFANNHRLARLGSATAPFSNWFLRFPLGRLVAHYLLGIHKARSLPSFARPSFPQWFRRNTPKGDGHRSTVLLFHDTFMDYNVPQIGIAATELLEKAGFRVELTDSVCCCRPMISLGFLSKAAEHARINVTRLFEHARRGTFIVGCEPSCLLTLRDEYVNLVQEPELKEKAKVVAQQCLMIDEFLAMLTSRGELELEFRQNQDGQKPLLFHAHCHQKALADPAKSMELLGLAGYQAEMLDTTCCGMAGAYGYEKEHYEASRAAGERGLFPALRAQPQAEMVVTGVSCRQQIQHFCGRRARHVVEALRDAVA
ncbi:MAG: 4Fe-4S dicluster domain-containing protein [Dehalococcoidia bacterium]